MGKSGQTTNSGVLSEIIQRCNLQIKAARFCEFSEADPERAQVISGNIGRLLHQTLAHVIDAIAVQPEAVRFICTFNQMLNIPSDTKSSRSD